MEVTVLATIPEKGSKLMISDAPGRQDTCVQRSLKGDLERLKSKDVQVIVCLLEWSELPKLGLTDYPKEVQDVGMIFYQFSISNGEKPKAKNIFSVTSTIIKHLSQGDNVLVHCREGLSRSGMVCACCLAHYNYQPGNAMIEVKKRRKGALANRCYVGTIESYYEIINRLKSKCLR